MLFAILGVLCLAAVARGQCGGNLVDPQGDVSSPNYPAEYGPNLDCKWTIPARGGSVTVTFQDFVIQEPETTFIFFSSCKDYVEILIGDSDEGRYCGTDMPDSITTYQDVHIIFKTDDTVGASGFQFSYTTQRPLGTGCGTHLDDSYGVVTSPNYPADYPNNADCTWTIPSNPYGTTVTFTDFMLEDGDFFSGCSYDYVEIFDGRDSIGTYCGDDIPPRVSTTKEVRIKFETDSSVVGQGFRFEYRSAVPASTANPPIAQTTKDAQTTKPDGSGDGIDDSFLF